MEIERKCLVATLPDNMQHCKHVEMEQCYLSISPTLRIRKAGDVCVMTYKRRQPNSAGVLSNVEIEFPIPHDKYLALRDERISGLVQKTRYFIPLSCHTAEMDIFHGTHNGLRMVEVEFSSLDEAAQFRPPIWFGREVTQDRRYSNAALADGAMPETE